MKLRALLLASAMILPTTSFASTAPLAAGVFLGSPTSGLTLQYWDRVQFGLGLDTLSFSVDAKWYLSEFTGRTDLAPFYTYTGLQWVDDNEDDWGPRAGLGFILPIGSAHMYAEAGPTWYVDSSNIEFEGALGFRFQL
ncbi:hypothetical protein C9I98_20360 [Photobacterium sanctipauli]|uniref:Outer membrane protein beta-barrel domain-containing protein n=1 Tax=Photobacterium sanctipauli TaxID=1342794 RepID=A0A2T3NN20_9GAMM|nr:hypothetical protein [Photobacterium sanctipauli]PSW16901.1 hypothetical protein C9I98_20360 [Photobacterium sanctipauli]